MILATPERFTALVTEEDHEATREVYQVSTAWSMAVSWPVYVVVGCAPLTYLSLFGEAYQDAGVPVVYWMVVGMMATLLAGLELRGPHVAVSNSWRADLDRVRQELVHEQHD